MSVAYDDPRESLAQNQSFGQTFFVVSLFHAALIVFLLIWGTLAPPPEPPLPFLTMVALGDLVQGEAGEGAYSAASPSPAPAPQTAPQVRVPAPPPQMPVESRLPQSAGPGEWGMEDRPEPKQPPKPQPPPPKPVKKTPPEPEPPKPEPKPVVKPKPQPKKPEITVNLKEVTRKVETPAAPKPKPEVTPPPMPQPAVSPPPQRDVARELAQRLKTAGVTDAVKIGKSGSAGGNANRNQWYYTLIRDQMHSAWLKPPELIGQQLTTIVQIAVAPDGGITNVKITESSGNAAHDRSAAEAARKVGKIRKPRPEGVPELIDVTFKDRR